MIKAVIIASSPTFKKFILIKKIAINGFGRIGRAALKVIMDTHGLEIVAINDLLSIENAAYLLKYDSVYGRFDQEVHVHNGHLQIGDREITYLSEKDPSDLPWKDLDVEIVIESTGFFTTAKMLKNTSMQERSMLLFLVLRKVKIPQL